MSAFSLLDLNDRSDGSQLPLNLVNNPNDSARDYSEPVTVIEPQSTNPDDTSSDERQIPIGTPMDQSLVHYTARLVTSRFLLTGSPGQLVDNGLVRVSIKNLALLVVACCVRLDPGVLLMPVVKHGFHPEFPLLDESDKFTDDQTGSRVKEELPICVIDNHFSTESSDTATDSELIVDAQKAEDNLSRSLVADKVEDINEFSQRIHDVLLFFAESDPMIRGNCIVVAENFVRSVLDGSREKNVDMFVESWRLCSDAQTMSIMTTNGLLGMILEVS